MFKTRVKKRIDRIKRARLLHILYHTHPADLGIVLQMKRRHKFERRSERMRMMRGREGEREEERGKGGDEGCGGG